MSRQKTQILLHNEQLIFKNESKTLWFLEQALGNYQLIISVVVIAHESRFR